MKRGSKQATPRDWEGFEHIQQVERREELCSRTVAKESCRLPAKETFSINRPRQSSANFSYQERTAAELPKIEQKKSPPKRQTVHSRPEEPRPKPPVRSFPQIKILKNPCSLEQSGILVYKSGLPATSDRMLCHLKDVNLSQPIGNDMHIRDITFSSKFQCGNLCCAYKMSQFQYTLHMRADTNTLGHRQWYYFSVKNKRACTVKFNIREFKKSTSLYSRGMKPYVISKRVFQRQNSSWMQQGENVRYKKVEREDGTRAWYLTFDFTFLHDNDEVFFAACPPYSYSFLLKEVEGIVQGSRRKCRMDVDRTNKSICGLDIPILTITHNNFDESQPCNYIVVIARSHPGESASSWVINGMLKHFASADPSLDDYPRNLVIKLVPMVNVDGVFLGNYRTGVMGKDFNRKFASARSNLFPEIQMIRAMVKQLKKEGRVTCFIDLHGHSIQKNSFIFGPATHQSSNMYRLPEELDQSSNYFKLSSCRFRKDPQGNIRETARAYFQQRENVLALTIENSLGMYCRSTDHITFPMLIADWERFGDDVARAMLKLSSSKSDSLEASLKKTQPMNFYKPEINNSIMNTGSSCIRSTLGSLVRQKLNSMQANTNPFKIEQSGRQLTEENLTVTRADPAFKANRRFKSTEKRRHSQPSTAKNSPADHSLNVRQILRQAEKLSATYAEATTSTVKFGATSQPKINNNRETVRNSIRASAQMSVEEVIREDLQNRIAVALDRKHHSRSTQEEVDASKLSENNNSDDNDSDGEEQDLPEVQWQALAKGVLQVVEEPSPHKRSDQTEEKIAPPLKVNIVPRKKPEVVAPNAFRQMRFTMSKLHPNRPTKLQTLEKIVSMSPEANNHEKPRTEPSIILAEKYLSEQLSVFSGGKLVLPAPETVYSHRRGSIFNQKHVLERIKHGLCGAPALAKYFKRRN